LNGKAPTPQYRKVYVYIKKKKKKKVYAIWIKSSMTLTHIDCFY
jgi:hypothetical protein